MTTDTSISDWSTLEQKKFRAEALLDQLFGIASRVDIEYHDFKPKVSNNRIEDRWLNVIIPDEIDKRYDIVVFHFSVADALDLGLDGYVGSFDETTVGVLVMDETDDVSIESKLIQLLAT